MIYLSQKNENRRNTIYLIKLIELPNVKGLINRSVKKRKERVSREKRGSIIAISRDYFLCPTFIFNPTILKRISGRFLLINGARKSIRTFKANPMPEICFDMMLLFG